MLKMKSILLVPISSWWLSPLCMLVCLALKYSVFVFFIFPWPSSVLENYSLSTLLCSIFVFLSRLGKVGFTFSLLLCLAAIGRSLVLKRWSHAAVIVAATSACFGLSHLVALATTIKIDYGEDHFADDLSVPEGIEIAEPGECTLWLGTGSPDGADAYFAAVSNALSQAGTDDETVSADVPSFARLARENRDILLRYLSTHPGWRVFAERDSFYANRIMMKHGDWDYPLNGFWFKPDSGAPERKLAEKVFRIQGWQR